MFVGIIAESWHFSAITGLYAFDHPQLGAVELGGWNSLYALSNPPPAWREAEIAPFPAWLVWHLLISPRLECYDASATRIGSETYRVRLVLALA